MKLQPPSKHQTPETKKRLNNDKTKKTVQKKKNVNEIRKYFESKNEDTSNSTSSKKIVNLMLGKISTNSDIANTEAEISVKSEVMSDINFGGLLENPSTSSSRRAPPRTRIISDNHATSTQESRAQPLGIGDKTTREAGYSAPEQGD